MPQISNQNLDINRIVEKVLDQIAQEAKMKKEAEARRTENNQTRPAKTKPTANPTATGDCQGNDDELFVADRVVTLQRIERQLAGKKRLAIVPGAVLTPSVRDYLKENRISICTAIPNVEKSDRKTVSVVAARTSYDPTELTNRLVQQRFSATASSYSCLIETTDHLAKELADPERLGVILTRHQPAALCLANRHATLRAVSVDREDQVEATVATVGANLMIVSPRGRSCFELERIITRFLRMPTHACPDVLRTRLA